jgi:hypothetical protein
MCTSAVVTVRTQQVNRVSSMAIVLLSLTGLLVVLWL